MTGTTTTVERYITSVLEPSTLKLARYAQIVEYDENPFWGVNHNIDDRCRHVWTLDERKQVAKYLGEAQLEIENELHYYIGYKWTVEDKRRYTIPAFTRWGYLTAFGVMAESDISIGEAVDATGDPCIIGPIATALTDTSEIVIYHPGTDHEVIADSIVIAGGNLTIRIPRCRLIATAFADNPEVGYDYGDYATWGEGTVDVKRRYNDTTTQGILSTNHKCSSTCAAEGCSAYTQTACGYLENPRLGKVRVLPANYADGVWTKVTCLCSNYNEMQLNYLSGMPMDSQLEDIIIRLAHSKMPKEPCGCDPLKHLWERDTKIPETMSINQAICKFGMSAGAWNAWQWTQRRALVRGGIVG